VNDWRLRAACRGMWDLFFDGERTGEAIHLCRWHCPVLTECRAETLERAPMSGVQAGLAWVSDDNQYRGRPSGWAYRIPQTCETCRSSR
jgi:hypothetical protein